MPLPINSAGIDRRPLAERAGPKVDDARGQLCGKIRAARHVGHWCGPCQAEYPSLKLAQQLYGDRLTVVGIHDNTVPPALVAEHVKQQKLTFPIAIDVPDGRLVQAYSKLGLIEGYPGYLLLSPEGKVLDADSCLPGPALRRFKLELIRAAIMGKGMRKDEGGRSGSKG
jgi:thiol-disulfide isomerase/thioredoxin